ncbi:Pect.2 family protein [Megaselia abdita]
MEEFSINEKKEVRVWCDGCYDLVHFGHGNLLRQAKAKGDKLIVGIHSDEEITRHKRPPVLTQEERLKLVQGIKWVDEVVENAPYITTLETLDQYNCDFCVHGDDITTTNDGKDTYQIVKDEKRLETVSRTNGISTTDLVNRILSLTRKSVSQETNDILEDKELSVDISKDSKPKSPWTGSSQFLLTTQKLIQFSDGKSSKPNDKVIYVAGAFDLFHVGHLDFLEKAKSQGDYLIVGLHEDTVIKEYKGQMYPIMNLQERTMNVLACKYVNEVVMGAPYTVDENLMKHLNVFLVCHGKIDSDVLLNDPYGVPKKLGKYEVLDSENDMTTEKIMTRIKTHRQQLEARNHEKERKEMESFAEQRTQTSG